MNLTNPRSGKKYDDANAWQDSLVSPETKRRIDAMVPWEWAEVICSCYSGYGTRTYNDDGSPRPCDRCGKVRRHWFARCAECKQYYVTLFKHDKKNAAFRYNRYTKTGFRGSCWTCLVGYYGKSETDVPPPDWATPREPRSLEDILSDEIVFDDFTF